MTIAELGPTTEAAVDGGSRRRLLLGGAGLASAAVLGDIVSASTADAAWLPRVNPYRRTRIPTRHELHMMNRMGFGYSRATWRQMRRAGGVDKWFAKQLAFRGVPENARTKSLIGWFPHLRQSAAVKWDNNKSGGTQAWEYARDFGNFSMLRRMYSNRQVHETMVEFWSNHLHVPALADLGWVQRWSYDQTLRQHALGRFDNMLVAATLHPAMLLFLDNWRSTKDAPNENHGRELLELHTVGRSSGYTEEMVKDSAKILSGYTVDAFGSWNGRYDRGSHTTGPVQVLGFSAHNGSSDGRGLAKDYLRYLAHHPATARTIARKLALRFVSDNPSDALVNHLAGVFRRSGTDIKATLRALVRHREFVNSRNRKVRTPHDDLIATVRVLGINAARPTNADSFSTAIAWAHKGPLVFQWPRPDGPPDFNSSWTSPTRMLGSFKMHWNLAGGYWPNRGVGYRRPVSWLPQRVIRFDQYVDHLCRLVHGRPSTRHQLKAACQATGVGVGERITRDHALADWLFPRLVASLLDTPTHMSR